MRGEPIVSTPLDALRCFVHSEIDLVVVEDFVLDRASIPLLWGLEEAMPEPLGRPDDGAHAEHMVYTLL